MCGDVNFPKINWETLVSSGYFKQKHIDLFEEVLSEQAVDFNTRGNSLLDIVLQRNCLAILNGTNI